jgi:hypothetical protein
MSDVAATGTSAVDLWPWLTLLLLGTFHGLNPGMGWLFAVALGLQEGSRRAVVRAFGPIALGHALSVALVVAAVAAVQFLVPLDWLRIGGAVALVLFGVYKLVVPMSHPRWVGMRVDGRQLTFWSFMMATAHGAGLMVVPVVLLLSPVASAADTSAPLVPQAVLAQSEGAPASVGKASGGEHGSHTHGPSMGTPVDAVPMPAAASEHSEHLEAIGGERVTPFAASAAVLLHTLAMFVTMAVIAVVIYEKLGLSLLRRAWFNVDRVWAIALILAGVLAFAL